MNLEVAECSQLVMTGEASEVEVEGMNRQIPLSHCIVVTIDHGMLLYAAGVMEYPRR